MELTSLDDDENIRGQNIDCETSDDSDDVEPRFENLEKIPSKENFSSGGGGSKDKKAGGGDGKNARDREFVCFSFLFVA